MICALFGRVRRYFNHGVFRAFFCDMEQRRFAYGIGAFLIALLICETIIALWLNNIFGETINILTDYKHHSHPLQEFNSAMLQWFLLSIGNDLIIVVLMYYYTNAYALRWRVAAIRYYMRSWERLPKKPDGASQRVEVDLKNFLDMFLMLATGLISAVITLIGFIPKLWILGRGIDVIFLPESWASVPGIILWILIGVCVIATLFAWLLGWWLKEIEDHKREADAALRGSLVLSEDFEIYPIHDHIRISPVDHVPGVYRAQMRFFKHSAVIVGWVAFYTLVLEILPYYIGVQSLFAGAILFGQITQIVDAFGNVKKSISFMIENRANFAVAQALHMRIVELEESLNVHSAH